MFNHPELDETDTIQAREARILAHKETYVELLKANWNWAVANNDPDGAKDIDMELQAAKVDLEAWKKNLTPPAPVHVFDFQVVGENVTLEKMAWLRSVIENAVAGFGARIVYKDEV